jgi:hypothetical protein
VIAESFAPPCDHRLGLHEDECFPPPGPCPGEPGPEHPVRGLQSRSAASTLVDAELVPERQDLDLQGEAGTDEAVDEGEEGA